jgi:hypothetical protein
MDGVELEIPSIRAASFNVRKPRTPPSCGGIIRKLVNVARRPESSSGTLESILTD